MIRPLGNRVVVEPLAEKHERFYLPPELTTFTRETRPMVTTTRGRVLAVGPDVSAVVPGELVRCSDSCGQLLRVDGQEIRVIREDDIAAVLT